MLDLITEKLAILNQTHLLKFYNELDNSKQKKLLKQIDCLDLSVLDEKILNNKRGTFSPPFAMSIDEIERKKDYYIRIGLQAVRDGKIGAVLLAGGQGSRLGFEKPKGMFNIGINKELYIFECLINNILEVVRAAGAWIPLFIMTSTQNDHDTKAFFEEHNYFGYSKANIMFFVQEQFPTIDLNGKLMLSDKGTVSTAPNGNGGWYSSMVRSGVFKILKDNKLEWLNVFAVDNVLQKIADPCFIGAVIDSGSSSGSKVVAKASPDERVGVMCLEDGKPSIVEYYEMTDEMLNSREPDGSLSYNYGVILNYLFRISDLDKALKIKLPIHKAFKKINYIDENGNYQNPDEPNAYKFETLVLDMVKIQDSCLAFEVDRKREFAPVKNKTGVDSVESARELLKLNNIEI